MSDEAMGAAQRGLLFVPDISGFTEFVGATEIRHSRHIVEELLEKLIDADTLGLEVSEVEGDAILFYRFGEPPTAPQFFEQVRGMFVAFHGHLRLYQKQRICRCGACAAAHGLSLKIVGHYGDIARSRVKQHAKLFGPDVIAAHRLLKNDIALHEYALFTRGLAEAWPPDAAPPWARRENGSSRYDLGAIDYGYAALAPLLESVPEPSPAQFGIGGATQRVFSVERAVGAPLDTVFEFVTDLQARALWIEGAKRIELPQAGVNRIGTRHRCVVDATSPVVVSSAIQHAADSITFTETDERRTGCAVFEFRREAEALTRVRVEFLVRDALPVRVLFRLLLARKLRKQFAASLENLARHFDAAGRARAARTP